MARVRCMGAEFTATPVRDLGDGDWIMRSHEHGTRFTVGTEFLARAHEILSMDETPAPPPAVSQANLEAAMAQERTKLPTVEELLARSKASNDAENSVDPAK